MDGAGSKTIRDRVEARFFDAANPMSPDRVADRLMVEFSPDQGGAIRTTERRLRTIIAQAVELGAKQHAAFVDAADIGRAPASCWPPPRWREGFRRLYLAATGIWAIGLGVYAIDEMDRWSYITPGMALARWTVGVVIPAGAVLILYRAAIWIGRGFRVGPASRN